MASLLADPLFEISGRGPSTNKNFYNFVVTKSNVIWRWWLISPRAVYRLSKPGQLILSYEDFLDDIKLQKLEDVGQLGRTSHRFRQLCGSEDFWEQAVRRRCKTVSAEVSSLAREVGWRNIFFTNKLQLQKLISRRRLRGDEQKAEETHGRRSETSHPDLKPTGLKASGEEGNH
ncbi:F-box only protein 36b isoform X2 [Dunckerocampus dactyliophorus]|uniref:F-box only protein 36b isoform X2 n=1 Tax=Dunckerocampus dactyliophorus TaxID=161453 RepID=UPI0024061C40|nr:F-box only protein 36b isoform X2 [Dunckerocampus dactyliophorus]